MSLTVEQLDVFADKLGKRMNGLSFSSGDVVKYENSNNGQCSIYEFRGIYHFIVTSIFRESDVVGLNSVDIIDFDILFDNQDRLDMFDLYIDDISRVRIRDIGQTVLNEV